jgi:hypothetical protein
MPIVQVLALRGENSHSNRGAASTFPSDADDKARGFHTEGSQFWQRALSDLKVHGGFAKQIHRSNNLCRIPSLRPMSCKLI